MFEQEREWLERASPKIKRRLFFSFLGLTLGMVLLVVILRFWWGGEATPVSEDSLRNGTELVETETDPGPAAPTEILPSKSGLSPEGNRVLSQHFQSLGGRSTLMDLKTIRLEGILRQPDEPDRRLVVLKRGGDHVRINLSFEGRRISLALSPDDAWNAFWQNGRLVQVQDASASSLWNLEESVALLPELLVAWNRGWPITFLGDREFEYQLCHAFEVEPYGEKPLQVFLDPDTLHDVGIRKVSRDPNGELVTYLYTKEDFQPLGKYVHPKLMKIYRNGEFLQEILVDNLIINGGVLSSSFDRPNPIQ